MNQTIQMGHYPKYKSEAHPIHHIENIVVPSLGHNPKNIFFLTADAFGVLPPVSKLNRGQANVSFYFRIYC